MGLALTLVWSGVTCLAYLEWGYLSCLYGVGLAGGLMWSSVSAHAYMESG